LLERGGGDGFHSVVGGRGVASSSLARGEDRITGGTAVTIKTK